jgi:signal transduction histidine kinase
MAESLGESHPIVVAARRALAVSRDAIGELSDPVAATVGESLDAVAQELRDRFEIPIVVDVGPDVELEPAAREHVARIAREAIANAARHGGARNLIVSLQRRDANLVLRVLDDGCGMLAADGTDAREGFGLGSMRERAATLGGSLRLHAGVGGGTELEVIFR